MLDFRRFIIISIILDLLDSYSTYVFIKLDLGYEANPIIAAQINTNPEFVFILFFTYVVIAVATYAFWQRIYFRLPETYRMWADRFASTVAVIAMAFKSAVVINNFLGITMNFTPIAYLFEKIGLFK